MLIRRLARPLLATIFIYGGTQALRHAEAHAKAAEPVLRKVVGEKDQSTGEGGLEALPTDPVTLVRIDAGIKIGAGLALAAGRFPRLAATLLAGSLIPTTLAGHRFWEIEDPQQRAEQQIHFLKNTSLLGGLAIAAVDTGGKPSAGYRARRRARKMSKKSHEALGAAKAVTATEVAKATKAGKARKAGKAGKAGRARKAKS